MAQLGGAGHFQPFDDLILPPSDLRGTPCFNDHCMFALNTHHKLYIGFVGSSDTSEMFPRNY